MSEETKEIPLKERIEKLLESGWVNEFNYLESQLQEARYLVVILQQKVEQLEKENEKLKYLVDDSHTMKAFIVEHNKVEQLENIIKEAIEELSYMSTNAYVEDYDIREKHYNLLMNILNKGDNNGRK